MNKEELITVFTQALEAVEKEAEQLGLDVRHNYHIDVTLTGVTGGKNAIVYSRNTQYAAEKSLEEQPNDITARSATYYC